MLIISNREKITTKCYYTLVQSSYTLRQVVLQITTAIKNYKNYYKLRQNTMAKKPCFNTVERGHELEAGLNEKHELTWSSDDHSGKLRPRMKMVNPWFHGYL